MVVNLPNLSYEMNGFLIGRTTKFNVGKVTFGNPDIRDNDVSAPRRDGTKFGRDFLDGRVITFDITLLGEPGGGALDDAVRMETAWLADDIRSVTGATAVLRLRRGERTRRVYGRPRRFLPQPSPWGQLQGLIPILCDFQCSDHLYYSDTEHTNTVTIVPPPAGGYHWPFDWPRGSVAESFAPGVITIGGDKPAWVCFLITGPITRPTIDVVGGWKLALDLTLQAGETVAIDPRPWSRGIRLSSGANASGKLLPGSPRLQDVSLAPGQWEVVLRGTDTTGTARMATAWRETFAGL